MSAPHRWLSAARDTVQSLYPDASPGDQAMLAAALLEATACEAHARMLAAALEGLGDAVAQLGEAISERR